MPSTPIISNCWDESLSLLHSGQFKQSLYQCLFESDLLATPVEKNASIQRPCAVGGEYPEDARFFTKQSTVQSKEFNTDFTGIFFIRADDDSVWPFELILESDFNTSPDIKQTLRLLERYDLTGHVVERRLCLTHPNGNWEYTSAVRKPLDDVFPFEIVHMYNDFELLVQKRIAKQEEFGFVRGMGETFFQKMPNQSQFLEKYISKKGASLETSTAAYHTVHPEEPHIHHRKGHLWEFNYPTGITEVRGAFIYDAITNLLALDGPKEKIAQYSLTRPQHVIHTLQPDLTYCEELQLQINGHQQTWQFDKVISQGGYTQTDRDGEFTSIDKWGVITGIHYDKDIIKPTVGRIQFHADQGSGLCVVIENKDTQESNTYIIYVDEKTSTPVFLYNCSICRAEDCITNLLRDAPYLFSAFIDQTTVQVLQTLLQKLMTSPDSASQTMTWPDKFYGEAITALALPETHELHVLSESILSRASLDQVESILKEMSRTFKRRDVQHVLSKETLSLYQGYRWLITNQNNFSHPRSRQTLISQMKITGIFEQAWLAELAICGKKLEHLLKKLHERILNEVLPPIMQRYCLMEEIYCTTSEKKAERFGQLWLRAFIDEHNKIKMDLQVQRERQLAYYTSEEGIESWIADIAQREQDHLEACKSEYDAQIKPLCARLLNKEDDNRSEYRKEELQSRKGLLLVEKMIKDFIGLYQQTAQKTISLFNEHFSSLKRTALQHLNQRLSVLERHFKTAKECEYQVVFEASSRFNLGETEAAAFKQILNTANRMKTAVKLLEADKAQEQSRALERQGVEKSEQADRALIENSVQHFRLTKFPRYHFFSHTPYTKRAAELPDPLLPSVSVSLVTKRTTHDRSARLLCVASYNSKSNGSHPTPTLGTSSQDHEPVTFVKF